MRKLLYSSFSLIEVLIFVAILGLFFVAAASITTVSIRNMKTNENKIIATHYAEELLNWLRTEKESDWSLFAGKTSIIYPAVPPTAAYYCFETSPIPNWPASVGECQTTDLLNSQYLRNVAISKDDASSPTKFFIAITVSWQEGGNSYEVPLNTVFTVWE